MGTNSKRKQRSKPGAEAATGLAVFMLLMAAAGVPLGFCAFIFIAGASMIAFMTSVK